MGSFSIKFSKYVLPALFLFGISGQQKAEAKDTLRQNVKITLTVLAPACSIKTDDLNLEINFKEIINRDFYYKPRAGEHKFNLHLENCDPRITKRLKIKFLGQTSQESPDLLAVRSDGQVSGIAIGIEKTDGTLMPFNKISEFPLLENSRENVIPLRAFVQAEPSAIKGKTIGAGYFTAIATFEVSYD